MIYLYDPKKADAKNFHSYLHGFLLMKICNRWAKFTSGLRKIAQVSSVKFLKSASNWENFPFGSVDFHLSRKLVTIFWPGEICELWRASSINESRVPIWTRKCLNEQITKKNREIILNDPNGNFIFTRSF